LLRFLVQANWSEAKIADTNKKINPLEAKLEVGFGAKPQLAI
jgi:hypothetical protein